MKRLVPSSLLTRALLNQRQRYPLNRMIRSKTFTLFRLPLIERAEKNQVTSWRPPCKPVGTKGLKQTENGGQGEHN